MTKPTPSEQRKREKNINSFNKYWYIDVKTSEIRHIKAKTWSKFFELFWKRKYTVDTLYWWSSREWASSKMMPFPIAVKHDDLPLRSFIRKHQMTNGWTISTGDLKYLYRGPLVDESGSTILIKTQSTLKNIISILSQLRPLSWIISLILILYRFREEVVELWEIIKNAL